MTLEVLIVDDDIKICDLLQRLFINNNIKALYTTTPHEARILIKYLKFDALVVDYMLGEENGIDFIYSLHNQRIFTPSLMLTAVDEINNKIDALTKGADDYLTKPFNSQELILRINKIVKRNLEVTYGASNIIQVKDLVYNTDNNSLKIKDIPINLSSNEEEIFKILIANINKTIYKEEILQILSKPVNETNLHTLNVAIMRLRKKIEGSGSYNKYIKTVRGKGFALVN
ncbi:Response regulator transcription factor [Candidatus Hepatincolaceae symbiont of Richtersius coronifer]